MLQKKHGFDAQNAGNRISKLLDFKFYRKGMPPDPPRGKGPCGPFTGNSCLLHLQLPLITKVIETPESAHYKKHLQVKRIEEKHKIFPCNRTNRDEIS